jgi:hypothetical protein
LLKKLWKEEKLQKERKDTEEKEQDVNAKEKRTGQCGAGIRQRNV